MLDQNDLQAIAELIRSEIAASEERTAKRFEGMEKRLTGMEKRFDDMEERFSGMENRFDDMEERTAKQFADMEERTAKRIEEASRQAVRDAVSQAIAYSENTVERKLDVIKEGLDLALETHIPVERIERIEEDVATLKSLVHHCAEEIEQLKKAQ